MRVRAAVYAACGLWLGFSAVAQVPLAAPTGAVPSMTTEQFWQCSSVAATADAGSCLDLF
jgi:hypothetical protein